MENEQENYTIFSLQRIYPVAQDKRARIWSPGNKNSKKFHVYRMLSPWRENVTSHTSGGTNYFPRREKVTIIRREQTIHLYSIGDDIFVYFVPILLDTTVSTVSRLQAIVRNGRSMILLLHTSEHSLYMIANTQLIIFWSPSQSLKGDIGLGGVRLGWVR